MNLDHEYVKCNLYGIIDYGNEERFETLMHLMAKLENIIFLCAIKVTTALDGWSVGNVLTNYSFLEL